ncbi:hypothetical protein [Anoxybacteroides tepidamans]|uniref:hypothetical protein n=1 Tax=Anoxybacteroides tepidamans TaxID=265948 RepID=UPI0004829470|nr:hypothetical protein [Anoxybacillus tepidamans]
MFKKILISAGILIILGTSSYSLINKPSKADTAVENQKEQKRVVTKEKEQMINTLERVAAKIHKKYQSVVVSMNSEKELVIQVKGDQDYFNSVKNDI